jgi:transcriptional regulator GlxA family with amidase domain
VNIGIYIYNQAEVLDFSGPFEVFSTASRVCENDEPFNVFLIGEFGETVTARSGYKVIPNYGFHNHPKVDVLIIVGGVHTDEMNKARVIEWISQQAKISTIVAAVCTGAFLLAQAKVLQTQKVTTHWEDIPDLRRMFPNLDVIEGVRWVDEGNLITSGGISAGIDMSLHLVSKLYGDALADKTAKQMEFVWTKNS